MTRNLKWVNVLIEESIMNEAEKKEEYMRLKISHAQLLAVIDVFPYSHKTQLMK